LISDFRSNAKENAEAEHDSYGGARHPDSSMDPGTIPSCAQQLEVTVLIFYQFDPVLGVGDGF
jgi:hypothetical protein